MAGKYFRNLFFQRVFHFHIFYRLYRKIEKAKKRLSVYSLFCSYKYFPYFDVICKARKCINIVKIADDIK